MKVEMRGNNRLVLVCENEDESKMVDAVCGSTVDDDGLIATTTAEVRLSDGYGPHYILIKKPD